VVATLALDEPRQEEAQAADHDAGDRQPDVECNVHLSAGCNRQGTRVLDGRAVPETNDGSFVVMKPIKATAEVVKYAIPPLSLSRSLALSRTHALVFSDALVQ
jgi:hypothetical protein